MNCFMKLEIKSEVTSYSDLGLNLNIAIKLAGYLLGDYQAKSNSVWVHFLGLFEESKEFEKLGLILFRNTDSCVAHGNVQELFKVDSTYLDYDVHISILGKLERIWLEAQKHLHYSLLVSFDHWVVETSFTLILILDVHECSMKPSLVVFCFSLLNYHHVVHCFHYVKLLNVYTEFSLFDLGEVKHVLHHKLKTVGAWLLNF